MATYSLVLTVAAIHELPVLSVTPSLTRDGRKPAPRDELAKAAAPLVARARLMRPPMAAGTLGPPVNGSVATGVSEAAWAERQAVSRLAQKSRFSRNLEGGKFIFISLYS